MLDIASESVVGQLARMQQDYGIWLQDELGQLVAEAMSTPAEIEARERWSSLRSRLHKIVGGAGTFGFSQASDTCRQLEQQLDRALSSDDIALLTDMRTRLPQLLQAVPDAAVCTPSALATAIVRVQPHAVARPEFDRPRVDVLSTDADFSTQLGQLLESFHYDVRLYSDVAALRRACTDQHPDALILELHSAGSTGTDGLSMAASLQQEMGITLPLFMIEAPRDFKQQLAAVRAGVDGFIERPLDSTRVAELVESRLRGHRAPPLRVLMVDDDSATLARHRLILADAGFAVSAISEAEQTLAAMEQFNPDVLVLDVNMPGCSGPELAQIIRFDPRWLRVPIVYLSASGDADQQFAAMTKAGDDFVVKPIAASALVASVTARARRARMLSAALSRDSLTGLLKHGDIKEQLAASLSLARRNNQPLCVAMIDIDHFKQVNDSYGHLVGDEVIRGLANLLRRRLRESDLLGRYGGEEFLAVLHNCNAERAAHIFNELRETFAQLEFHAAATAFTSTFSAGIIQDCGALDAEGLIGSADQHLYRAKHGGRNQVAISNQHG